MQVVALTRDLGDVQRLGAVRVGLGAALLWRQGGQIGGLALAPPGAQGGRVHALAAHQRANLTGLGAAVGCLETAALVGVGEPPALSAGNDLGVCALGV